MTESASANPEYDDELKRAHAHLARMENAHNMACQNIAELNSQRAHLLATLTHALTLIDQLITEMRLANVTPPGAVIFSKASLDQAMRKLLGKE